MIPQTRSIPVFQNQQSISWKYFPAILGVGMSIFIFPERGAPPLWKPVRLLFRSCLRDEEIKMILCELIEWQCEIKMFGNAKEVAAIGFDGAVTDTGCGFGCDEPGDNFLNCRAGIGFYNAFSCHNGTPCLLQKWARRQGVWQKVRIFWKIQKSNIASQKDKKKSWIQTNSGFLAVQNTIDDIYFSRFLRLFCKE